MHKRETDLGEIGVRELKLRASEILRQVREEQKTFTVTYRGKVVARLGPPGRCRQRRQSQSSGGNCKCTWLTPAFRSAGSSLPMSTMNFTTPRLECVTPR